MSRFTTVLLAAAIATLMGAAGMARADQDQGVVYEYTDGHGEVHYTDQWVPGAKLIRIQTAHGAADAAAMQGIQSENSDAAGSLQQQQTAQAVQQDETKAHAAQCTQAKAQYQSMIASRRIYTLDKSGQRHYLSDSQADAARVQAREAMQSACGSGS